MSIQQFHDSADALIDLIANFVKANIKSDGDKESDCQRTAIEHELMGLSATMNGTTSDELIQPDTDHERVFLEMDRATAEAIIEAVDVAIMSPSLSDQTVELAQAATTFIVDQLPAQQDAELTSLESGDWIIYSPMQESTAGSCGGYWDAIKAVWTSRDQATHFHEKYVGHFDLPASLNNDRQWVCDHLTNAKTPDSLTDELAEFCHNFDLTPMSADEMLMEPETVNGAPFIRLWLNQFIEQWEAAVQRDHAQHTPR